MKLPVNYKNLTRYQRIQVRGHYIRLQKNLCYHCKTSLSEEAPSRITSKYFNWKKFPIGFLDHRVHLHHSHETGMTIGAVHNYCNADLWQYYGE